MTYAPLARRQTDSRDLVREIQPKRMRPPNRAASYSSSPSDPAAAQDAETVSSSPSTVAVQAMLEVGAADSPLEQEAE